MDKDKSAFQKVTSWFKRNPHEDEFHNHEDENIFKSEGIIEFSTGYHEVFIKTKYQHSSNKKVWIHIDDTPNPTCSYLDKDLFSVKEHIPGGFVLMANVVSNGRKVFWEIR